MITLHPPASPSRLGLNDQEEEGVWRWNSDGSLVTWFVWAEYEGTGHDPDGGRGQNCVAMSKGYYDHKRITTSETWIDFTCDHYNLNDKRLVCQKGMYRCENSMKL